MATTDGTELLGDFKQAWKCLEDTLRGAASTLDCPESSSTLSQVLDFLKRNGVISKPEWTDMVLLQGTRDEVLYGGAVLTQGMVDKVVSLAADWKKRLQAISMS